MIAIARACREGALAAEIPVVISDRPGVEGITAARQLGIEAHVVSRNAAADRNTFELALGECIDAYRPDLVVLAGFMRVLSGEFVGRYTGKMLNIHPSLLPAYRGLHTHQRVLESGDAVHGASVHFVTPELDAGPVVLQSRLAVRAGDTPASLAGRVQATEHVIYSRVISWFAQGRLTWSDDAHACLDGKALEAPVVEEMNGETSA